MSDKKYIPTTYMVIYWDDAGDKEVKREFYPRYLYSFDDVASLLNGKEFSCDICEVRYWKKRENYIVVGKTYIWDNYKWAILP